MPGSESLLPVVAIADSFFEAVAIFAGWRARKKENPDQDALISSEPVRIVNDTLRMQYS